MRQIVLDTETTGIGPEKGHKIIEIGCVELVNRRLTGNHFHHYINPEREIDAGAYRVHGIGSDFLADKPLFKDILPSFIDYVDGSELIIHNAPFDVGFLNAELQQSGWQKKVEQHCKILDTLVLARNKHPGQKNNLDALCKRYDIDNSKRELHGALLDAEILAFVYLAMTGGQFSLLFNDENEGLVKKEKQAHEISEINIKTKVIKASSTELKSHQEFIDLIKDKSGIDLWD